MELRSGNLKVNADSAEEEGGVSPAHAVEVTTETTQSDSPEAQERGMEASVPDGPLPPPEETAEPEAALATGSEALDSTPSLHQPVMQAFPALGLSPAPLPQSLDPLHSLVSELPDEHRGSFLNCVLSLLLHVSKGGSLPSIDRPGGAGNDLAAEMEAGIVPASPPDAKGAVESGADAAVGDEGETEVVGLEGPAPTPDPAVSAGTPLAEEASPAEPLSEEACMQLLEDEVKMDVAEEQQYLDGCEQKEAGSHEEEDVAAGVEDMEVGSGEPEASSSMMAVEAEEEKMVPALELEREKAEKERLAEALRRMHDLGRGQVSDLRTFRAGLVEGTKRLMAECTADVARLGAKLLVGWEQEQKRAKTLEGLLAKEAQRRRKLFNEIQEMRGNIRVFCRVRPPRATPTPTGGTVPSVVSQSSSTEVLVRPSPGAPAKAFELDAVFGPRSTQAEVFAEVEALVTSVMDGYQSCILAYGQTGSGKTHTMEGSEQDPGINTRALQELFRLKGEKEASALARVQVECMMVEIYNESVRDLLAEPPAAKAKGWSPPLLELRQGEQGVYVQGARSLPVSSVEDVRAIMRLGQRHRSTAATRANACSSRSHSLLLATVTTRDEATHLTTQGRLILVDLAGSERLAKTGAEGQALKEAQSINKSLSSLGDVIAALRARQEYKGSGKSEGQHVPYRNSKLTYLLQDALGADNKALMIVQVSPDAEDAGETLCSLNFAARVNGVQLGSSKGQAKNDSRFFRDAMARLRSEAKDLEAKGQEAAATIATLRKEMAKVREDAEAQAKDGGSRLAALQRELAKAREAEKTANDKCEVLAGRLDEMRRQLAADRSAESVRAAAREEEMLASLEAARSEIRDLHDERRKLHEALASSKDLQPPPPPAPLVASSYSSTPLRPSPAPMPSFIEETAAAPTLLPPTMTEAENCGARPGSFYLMRSAQKQLRTLREQAAARDGAVATAVEPVGVSIYSDPASPTGRSATPSKPARAPAKRPLPPPSISSSDAENLPPAGSSSSMGFKSVNAEQHPPAKKAKKVTFCLPTDEEEEPEDGMDEYLDTAAGQQEEEEEAAAAPLHRPLGAIPENLLGTDAGTDGPHFFEPASSHRLTPYKRRPSFLAPTASSAAAAAAAAPPSALSRLANLPLGTATRIQQALPSTPSRLKKAARVPAAAPAAAAGWPAGRTSSQPPSGARPTQGGRWR